MSITQVTTRDTQLEKQRLGFDATMLELDAVPKVSVGSVVEASGALYVVSSAAETPTGTPADGAYLFFDPSGPSFVWSAVAGTYDATKGAAYNGSNHRQCRFRLTGTTTWQQTIDQHDANRLLLSNLEVDGTLDVIEGGFRVPFSESITRLAFSSGSAVAMSQLRNALIALGLTQDLIYKVQGSVQYLVTATDHFAVIKGIRWTAPGITIYADVVFDTTSAPPYPAISVSAIVAHLTASVTLYTYDLYF